jgi:iron(III) transport system permease protein
MYRKLRIRLGLAPPLPKESRGRRPPAWLFLPVIIICLIVALPVFYVILRAAGVGWSTTIRLLFRSHVYKLLINTTELVVSVTAFSAVIGVSTAWIIERTNIRCRNIWHIVITLPFAVPAFVMSYTWISISSLFEGFGGAVFILTMSSYPLVHLPVAASLRGMDPSLEESARSLGFSPNKTFWRVILPQLRAALTGGAILIALHMLAEFGTLSILRFQTFTTAIFDQYKLAFDNASAAMLAAVLLVLCFIILAVELYLRGRTRYARVGSGVSRPQKRFKLGWKAIFIWIGLTALAILGVGLPILTLIYWLLQGSSAAASLYTILGTTGASLGLGLGGAFLTTAAALPIVYLQVRYRGKLVSVAERLPYFIHALPGLVIALALVYFSVHYAFPIYQTVFLLLIAYSILYLPLAQSPIRATMIQAPRRLEEMGRTLGNKPFTAFLKITLPIISPGVGAGAALVFLEIMKELTATLLLIPIGFSTLAIQVWSHTINAEYAASAPYAAILILISGLPVYLLTVRSYGRKRMMT